MLFKSAAKINVSLRVTGLAENGYHLLEMVNLPLELHDVIDVEKIPSGETYITCDEPSLSYVKENLCYKAYSLLKEEFGIKDNYMISIHKEIPFAAGLGGGSSNAATTILALKKLSKIKAKEERFAEVGKRIGADVPYFFLLKPAVITGIGEKIAPFRIKKPIYVLLVKPTMGLSTKQIYSLCEKTRRLEIDTSKVVEGLQKHDFEMIQKYGGNDLLEAAASICPEIYDILSKLKGAGFACYGMTGAGSCCYALSDDQRFVKMMADRFEDEGYITKATKTLA